MLDNNFDARAEYAKRGRDLATGDFAQLVGVLKSIEPGLTGCDALAKARRMAPDTVDKMNGAPRPASYCTKDEVMISLAKNEWQYFVDQLRSATAARRRLRCRRRDARTH